MGTCLQCTLFSCCKLLCYFAQIDFCYSALSGNKLFRFMGSHINRIHPTEQGNHQMTYRKIVKRNKEQRENKTTTKPNEMAMHGQSKRENRFLAQITTHVIMARIISQVKRWWIPFDYVRFSVNWFRTNARIFCAVQTNKPSNFIKARSVRASLDSSLELKMRWTTYTFNNKRHLDKQFKKQPRRTCSRVFLQLKNWTGNNNRVWHPSNDVFCWFHTQSDAIKT